MAIDVLNGARRQRRPLGIRVDDAVSAKKERDRRRELLRVVPAGAAKTRDSAGDTRAERVALVQPRVTTASLSVRPVTAAPRVLAVPAAGGVKRSVTAGPRLESDPMFDADVEQARKVATSVRSQAEPMVQRQVRAPHSVVRPARVAQRHRLTLRGQRVMLVLGLILSIGIGGAVGQMYNATLSPQETSTVTVMPGDSLWSIATTLAGPGTDPRVVVDQIALLNDLQTPLISAGQMLIVPAD